MSKSTQFDGCNDIAKKLLDCIKENPFKRFVGVCTDYDTQYRKCLKQEMVQRQQANAEASKKKTKELHQRIRQKAKDARERVKPNVNNDNTK